MPKANLPKPAYGGLRPEVDKSGQKDKLKLLKDLSLQSKLTKNNWQLLAPFLLPDELRRQFMRYPWSLADRRNLGLLIKVPICLQDPSFIRDPKTRLKCELIEVGWEPGMTDGPTSARIAVEDRYQTESGIHKPEPAKWDAKGHCFLYAKGKPITLVDENGQPNPLVDAKEQHFCPKLNNDQFHQVNVWAIAQRILEFYEDFTVLGRPVPWGFDGNRLIIKPHTSTDSRETGYVRNSKTLEFAYSGIVFDCLSHDIVAHETGHAVLDGIRPYFYDSCTLETLAFHEFVADLTAIMSALRNNFVRKIFTDCLEKDLPEKDFLANIGEEFGKAYLRSDFIRSAINKVTMDDVYQLQKDRPDNASHNSSQVLTGLIYDLLLKLYEGYRKRESTPDEASWHATSRLTQMALQPLDFLPPVDVAFSDYIKAFLIRDQLIDPKDQHRYRPLFRRLCKERKIEAPRAGKLSQRPRNLANPQMDGLLASRTSAYKYIHANREALRIPAKPDLVVDVYAAKKVDRTFFRLPQEIIVQYIWEENVQLKGKEFGPLENRCLPLLCGGTLVFDENANFRYWVNKPGTEFQFTEEQREGERRRKDLMDYVAACVAKGDKDAIEGLHSAISSIGYKSTMPVGGLANQGRRPQGELTP